MTENGGTQPNEARGLATTGPAVPPPPVGAPLPTTAMPVTTAVSPVTPMLPATPLPMVPTRATSVASLPSSARSTASTPTARQLNDLSINELEQLAADYGLDPDAFKTPQHLIAAIHDRRHLIASLDRDAMMDVLKWAGKSAPAGSSSEVLAFNIARIRTMRFHGLSQRGLIALAALRGLAVRSDEPVPDLVRKLKKQEGFFQKISRKRRALIGKWVSNMIGESPAALPPGTPKGTAPPPRSAADARSSTIRDDIEESGLLGGLTNRLKKSADSYVNQKLDEIEARIDRKLDEIDRRLAEWRDKEIANRLRILKITLWASVVVAAVSLIYAYAEVYIFPR